MTTDDVFVKSLHLIVISFRQLLARLCKQQTWNSTQLQAVQSSHKRPPHTCVWLEVQREGLTFAVAVWSLPISLDVSVCDTLLILLQLTQCQLPPAPERCFTHPEAVAADTQTQENGGLASTCSGFTTQWLGWAYLAALFTRLDTSL